MGVGGDKWASPAEEMKTGNQTKPLCLACRQVGVASRLEEELQPGGQRVKGGGCPDRRQNLNDGKTAREKS